MNLADRSIALVDIALRRRFAFFTLEPQFNEAWRNHVKAQGVHPSVIDAIRARLLRLNDAIADHHRLGSAFAVGHSFVTPTHPMAPGDDGRAWFSDVIRTEIQPLLEEYCFDSASDAKSWLTALRLDTV
jgi:5-methylcytosine-specific restriction protein B